MALNRPIPPAVTWEEWNNVPNLRAALVAKRANRVIGAGAGAGASGMRPSTERPLYQKLIDVITSPLSAYANTVKSGLEEQKEILGKDPSDTLTFGEGLQGLLRGFPGVWNAPDFAEGFTEAFQGKPTYTGDVLREWLGTEGQENIDNPVERMALGATSFAGDVLLDPLTYIPGGGLTKLGKVGKAIPEEYIAKGADELAAATNPNLPKQVGQTNRYVRTRNVPMEPAPGQRIFEAGTSGPARVISTPRQRAADLVNRGMERPGVVPATRPRSTLPQEGIITPRSVEPLQGPVSPLPQAVNQADVARAAGLENLQPTTVLSPKQLDKVNRMATRRVGVTQMATQATRSVEKYGQRWRQSAINNGQDPDVVNAAWNTVKADVDRMVSEVEEVVSQLPVEQQETYRQIGLNAIKVDTEKVMRQAAEEVMTAKELTEKIAARRAQGGLAKASEAPSEPVVAGPKSPEANPVNPEAVAPTPGTPASDIGRMLDEAAAEAETTAAVQSAKDTQKVVTVRPAGKKAEQVRAELKNETGPHFENFNRRLDAAIKTATSGHGTRKLSQYQIDAIRAELKVIVSRRLTRMADASAGRFNQFEQANLWEDILKYLRRTAAQGGKGKAGLYGQLGIQWNKEGAKQYLVARELYLALEPFMLDVSPGTIWNGVRKGSTKRWRAPTAEEIASGKFKQWAKVPAKGKKPQNLNVHFSFGQMIREMPDDILKQVFTKEQPPGPYAVAISNAAFWKAEEYLALVPEKTRAWLMVYDSVGHAAARAKAYANVKNAAVQGAVASTGKNMAQTAATKSGPRIIKEAKEAENAAATAAVGAGGDTAASVEAGVKAKAVATDIADEAVYGSDAAGVATKENTGLLNNPTNSKRGQTRQNHASRRVHRQVFKEYDAEALAGINRAGFSDKVATKNVPGKSLDSYSIDESFKARLATAFRTNYEKVTLYPIWQNSYGFMHEMHAAIGKTYNQIARKWLKGAAPEQRNALVKAAMVMSRQLDEAMIASPVEREALETLQKRMEGLLGSADVPVEASTIGKMGLEMEHVNRWLRYNNVRTRGKTRPLFQFEEVEGGHWIESIYGEKGLFQTVNESNIDEVIEQMHSVEKAVLGASSERMFVDDLVTRGFATSNPTRIKDGWVKVNSETLPYANDLYMHKDLADEMSAMLHFMEELKDPIKGGAIMRYFDIALRAFKTGVTIYNPQHHVRNMVGDAWLHYADGGRARHYTKAASIMDKYPYVWKKDEGFQVLGADEAFVTGREGAELSAKSNRVINTTNGQTGINFTDREVLEAFHRRGLAIPAENIEDLLVTIKQAGFNKYLDTPVTPWGGTVRAPFQGGIHNFWSNVSMKREHLARLSHMLHGVEQAAVPKSILKQGDKAVRDYILDNAVRRARKWHPDGLDLTKAERTVGRRLIPFYSWQRKSIPLILLAAVRRPVLFTYERKVNNAIGTASGLQEDYLPGDQLFPTWLRGGSMSASIGFVRGEDEEGAPNFGHRLLQGPGTPGTDFLEMVLGGAVTPGQVPGETIRDVGSQINPMLRSPAELISNTSWRTGAEVRNTRKANAFADYTEYIAENSGVPYVGVLSRGRTNKNPASIDLINWLSGASIIDTGGYETAAQLSERDLQAYLRDRAGQ